MTAEDAERRALHLFSEYERTGDQAALRQAAKAFQDAAGLAGSQTARVYHCNASQLLEQLFEQTGNTAFISEAAAAARNAIGTVPAGNAARGENAIPGESAARGEDDSRAMLVRLGDTLQVAYEWLGNLSDLQLAIQAFKDALPAYPAGSHGLAACHARLCIALRLAYERTEVPGTLRESIEAGRLAVAIEPTDSPADSAAGSPADNPDIAGFRWNLANALRASYERSHNADELREALGIARKSVAVFGPGSPQHAAALTVLASMLKLEYERTGELPVLRESVDAGRDAVEALTPPFLYLPTYKINLADTLRMLAERTGDATTAREAVLTARESVKLYQQDDPERGRALAILSQALITAGGFTSDRSALADAVGSASDALEATPADHPRYIPHLNTYVTALLAVYHETRLREFLDRALHAAANAVASLAPDDPLRATVQSNLCVVLEAAGRADAVSTEEIAQAERFARETVQATPPDSPGRARLLSNLGSVLGLRVEQTGDLTTARECVNVYSSVARMAAAAPAERIKAAQVAARDALRIGHRNQALSLAETAVGLVPQMTVRDVERASREYRIRAIGDLAATSAAAAIATGNPGRAVELLEQTRGLVLASTLDTRGDLSELRRLAPDLAGPFDELRRAANALDHESTAAEGSAQLTARQRELAAARVRLNGQWAQQLAQIRQRDGLDRFLLPQPIDELRKQARHGPIVYLTVHRDKGHALIVRDKPDDPVELLALPAEVTADAVFTQVSDLRDAQRAAVDRSQPASQRRAAQQRILGVLGWAWNAITEPVLRRLGRNAPPPEGGDWPRIWWCPSGLVAYLPLHAAGQQTGTDTVMDRVVSSYTPTIRALAYARERQAAPGPSAVVVAVPDAPECPPLDSAMLEAHAVRKLVPDATALPGDGAQTNREDVVQALREHGIAHFACHGVASWSDPASSRLILHDHLTSPLTLHDITRLHLSHAQLAYLSACSTTVSSPAQIDEATQLTAAFQLAGYRNVIGTLWPISDRTAVTVARDVYSVLTRDGTTRPDPDMAAQALHQATRTLRDLKPGLPTRWAAYIHYGV